MHATSTHDRYVARATSKLDDDSVVHGARPDFARDLLHRLERRSRIAPKYFYDAAGSASFNRACALPEYYRTRTESSILAFNLNMLHRANHELDGDFDVDAFDHCAFYESRAQADQVKKACSIVLETKGALE